MPSFDIVSQVDLQEVDNAVNNVVKEVATRYDFRGVETDIELNKQDKVIKVVTGDDMKMKAVRDLLITHFVRRKVDEKCLDWGEIEPTSKGAVKTEIGIKEGIDKDTAKKIVKQIKGMNLKKIQPAIQDDQVRVTGKSIDDLQSVIQAMKAAELGLPLQFVNMKS